MSALRVYVGLVAALAAAAMVAVFAGAAGGLGLTVGAPLLVLTAAVMFSEFFPVTIVRRDGNEELDVSHGFVLATLLVAGPAAAVLAQLVATIASSVLRRRVAIKAVFNVSQKVLAVSVAVLVVAALGPLPTLGAGDGLTAGDVGAFVVAALVFQLVNETAVSLVCALAERRPLLSFVIGDLRPAAFNAAVSLTGLLAAAGATVGVWLVPVMVAPLWAVRRSGEVAVASFEQARHDALTGLPNALALREALDEAMPRRDVALVMLDLDGFKDINDSLGHQTGDDVLRAVGHRLGEHADRARVFRLQGDEFVAIMDTPGAAGALAFADDLTTAFQRPFAARELEVEIGLSAGVATAQRGDCEPDSLLRRADVAMNDAKRDRSGYALYTASSDTADTARQVMAADLRRALACGELVVHYQPQVALRGGHVVGFEALVRWRRADGTLVPPGEFIPLAEHTSVIMPLTVHVLRTALGQCRRWSDEAGYEGRVGINLSARTLHHRRLIADVRSALEETGLAPQRLEVEITESALMADPAGARRTLQALHDLGVGILIDDFGTGYSSLAYLGTLPVDGIKIDRSFVAGMAGNWHDAVIVRSTIDLGHNLGLRVIAEGVEDAGTRDRLAALETDVGQGWLWSPALPAEEIKRELLGAVVPLAS